MCMYIHVALIITVFGIGYIAKLPMEMLINIVFIYLLMEILMHGIRMTR